MVVHSFFSGTLGGAPRPCGREHVCSLLPVSRREPDLVKLLWQCCQGSKSDVLYLTKFVLNLHKKLLDHTQKELDGLYAAVVDVFATFSIQSLGNVTFFFSAFKLESFADWNLFDIDAWP